MTNLSNTSLCWQPVGGKFEISGDEGWFGSEKKEGTGTEALCTTNLAKYTYESGVPKAATCACNEHIRPRPSTCMPRNGAPGTPSLCKLGTSRPLVAHPGPCREDRWIGSRLDRCAPVLPLHRAAVNILCLPPACVLCLAFSAYSTHQR